MNARINQIIHDLARAVVDQEIEIDNERQGDKFADDLWEQIVVTIDQFIDEKKRKPK